MAQDNKSTKADFWVNFYLLVITLPATIFAIGIEYKIFNCSVMMMVATAILIASPNLCFFLRAKKCCGPSDLIILLAFFSFVFSLFAGITFFREDHYESFTMSKADFSVFLLNKYNPEVLSELEKLNNKQLITVRKYIESMPEGEDFDRRSRDRTNKIKAGIALYCEAKLGEVSGEELEKLKNKNFVDIIRIAKGGVRVEDD